MVMAVCRDASRFILEVMLGHICWEGVDPHTSSARTHRRRRRRQTHTKHGILHPSSSRNTALAQTEQSEERDKKKSVQDPSSSSRNTALPQA